MEQKIYRVYGEDTFAHETFMVAEFNSREAAEKELQRCRDSVMHQCEELRDEFWIVDCTPKQVEEANRREWLDSDKCCSDSVAQADELIKMIFED